MALSERYPRGTAYHEAGHAVVAWSLGLALGAVSVSDDDASGSTQIGPSDHLPLVEQIAVCSAGIAAVEICGHPINELAGFKDHERIMHVIEVHGVSEEEQGQALRKEGYSFARARLEAHWSKVATLAELLVEHGRIEASEVMFLMQTITS
jgi:ATP-dependent Zn protease